ncbi:MAG: LacI family DNA-binding transcriptional regulator [Proteiniphilum sp.]
MKKVSIQDIADKLGVSKGTVSLVLSGKAKIGRVSMETSRKVRKMAAEMNYYPNEIARSLTTGITMTIGVIVTDISNEFFGNLTFNIQERAKKYGYSVITTNTNESLEEFNNAVTVLMNKQADGIILVPVDGGEKTVKRIIDRRIPMVQIDRFYQEIDASYVIVENLKSSFDAIELLIRKGHKRIGLICYDLNVSALINRKLGYTEALKQNGLLDTNLIKNINYENQEEEIKLAISELKNDPIGVDAIYFCSRRVFITGVKYMHIENIKIPNEMEVICFDKIDSFSITGFPISYIEQPIKQMGELAVDILLKQLNGDFEPNKIELPSKITMIN